MKSFRQGVIRNYTERRILWFLDWVGRHWPVDRKRTLVTGMGGGALYGARNLRRRNPKVFRRIVGRGRRGRLEGAMEALWGRQRWRIQTGSGKSIWDE